MSYLLNGVKVLVRNSADLAVVLPHGGEDCPFADLDVVDPEGVEDLVEALLLLVEEHRASQTELLLRTVCSSIFNFILTFRGMPC